MNPVLTASLLQAAVGCTAERAAECAGVLGAACEAYGINTPQRLAAFLAQVGHESGSFKYTTEVWKPTAAQLTYQGRMGNTDPGDGERYKGHGFLQITGRNNHVRMRGRLRAKFGPDVPDFEAEPERLADLKWAAISAADYWADRGLNAIADSGDFDKLSDLINIGHATSTSGDANGYADRLARYKRAQQALAVGSDPPPMLDPTISIPTEKSQQEKPMLPAILAATLPEFIKSIPDLFKLFGSGSEVAERNAKAAELAVNVVTTALGAKNAQDAIEMIQTDPSAAVTAQAAVRDNWFQLVEVGGGIEAARKANEVYLQPGAPSIWINPAFIVTLLLALMPFMLLVDVFFVHPDGYSGELRVQIVTGVLLVIGMIGGYWMGTSNSSQRKTELAAGAQPK